MVWKGVVGAGVAVLALVLAGPAMADGRGNGHKHGHHKHGHHGHGHHHGAPVVVYEQAPPVVVVQRPAPVIVAPPPPPRVMYAPPVVYAPVMPAPAPGLSIQMNVPLR